MIEVEYTRIINGVEYHIIYDSSILVYPWEAYITTIYGFQRVANAENQVDLQKQLQQK